MRCIFVLLEGIEPPSTVPKTVILSVELQERFVCGTSTSLRSAQYVRLVSATILF